MKLNEPVYFVNKPRCNSTSALCALVVLRSRRLYPPSRSGVDQHKDRLSATSTPPNTNTKNSYLSFLLMTPFTTATGNVGLS